MYYIRGYNTSTSQFQYFKVGSIAEIVDPDIVDKVILKRLDGIPEITAWADRPPTAAPGTQIILNQMLYFWSPIMMAFVFTDWYDPLRTFQFRPYTTWFHEYEIDGSEVINVA